MPCVPASTKASGASSGTSDGCARRIRSMGHSGSHTETMRFIRPFQQVRHRLARQRAVPAAFQSDAVAERTGSGRRRRDATALPARTDAPARGRRPGRGEARIGDEQARRQMLRCGEAQAAGRRQLGFAQQRRRREPGSASADLPPWPTTHRRGAPSRRTATPKARGRGRQSRARTGHRSRGQRRTASTTGCAAAWQQTFRCSAAAARRGAAQSRAPPPNLPAARPPVCGSAFTSCREAASRPRLRRSSTSAAPSVHKDWGCAASADEDEAMREGPRSMAVMRWRSSASTPALLCLAEPRPPERRGGTRRSGSGKST